MNFELLNIVKYINLAHVEYDLFNFNFVHLISVPLFIANGNRYSTTHHLKMRNHLGNIDVSIALFK